jgi:replicative DNA helicase
MPETETERVLDAHIKGLSLRQIATQENITVHAVRTTLKHPAILREIAEHRTKYAVVSYENACKITDLITQVIPKIDPVGLANDTKSLKNLAWVAKSQFDQSNAILGELIKNATMTGDDELNEAARMLAARVLRKAAELPSTVEAEEFTEAEQVPPAV